MKHKNIIIDSSSAILLYKSNFFDKLSDKYDTTITQSVFNEITCNNYPGSEYFQKLCSDQILTINNKNLKNSNNNKLLNLGTGERDSILLFTQYKFDFIIIDDGKGAKYCRNNNIPYINALLIPKIFYFSKIITEEKYLKKTEDIISLGRYSEKIIEFVYQCSIEELQPFLP